MKYRNFILIFDIEVPKGQPIVKRLFMHTERRKGPIANQYKPLKILREEGKALESFSPEAQKEVLDDINKYCIPVTERMKKTLTIFDTTLFNNAFEFYVESIVRLKNAKRKKNYQSDTMVKDPHRWNNIIMNKIILNQYKHTKLNELYGVLHDHYSDLTIMLPILFLKRKEDDG